MDAASTSTYLRVFKDLEELSAAAADAFAEAARRAVRERGRFSVALAGGGTPRILYRRLAADFRDSIPWSGVHLFWSDERFVPSDDADSNYRMVRDSLLDRVPVPEGNVHRPETEHDDPEECARRYESALRSFFHPEPPRFDWMLLGLGEDGHVAALVPGSPALDVSARRVVVVRESPKPPRTRLTMTLPLINESREIHFLVSGREKHAVLFDVLRGSENGLPARRVRPAEGSLHWWLDRRAGARIRVTQRERKASKEERQRRGMKKKARARKSAVAEAPQLEPELRERVARRAYEIYLQRGGEHRRDLDDWLQAEREILSDKE